MNGTWLSRNEQLDIHLRNAGSSVLYDAIFLFIFPPLSIVSIIGNLVAYRIFSEGYFRRKPLYTYLRMSCLNSSIINLAFGLAFICESRRYLQIANTEFGTYFRCILKIPIINMCYFYGSILDIILALDRLVELTRFKETFRRRFNPTYVCLFSCLFCIAFNAPYLFVFEPKNKLIFIIDQNGSNSSEIFNYYGESKFALSPHGKAVKAVLYFTRDILTLIIIIFINTLSLILLRTKYKVERVTRVESSEQLQNPTQSSSSGRSSNREKNSPALARHQSIDVIRKTINRHNLYLSIAQVNIMLTKMVFIICVFSALEHIFLLVGHLMFTNYFKPIKLDIIFLANLSVLLKHSIPFFIFYRFNAFFKSRLFSKRSNYCFCYFKLK